MEKDQYVAELTAALSRLGDRVAARIPSLLRNLPSGARQLEIVIFPSQDGEGDFSVRATLDGPDLHVLNRAIDPYAELLSVTHAPGGFEPGVPMVDPSDVDFEVNDMLVDVVAEWLAGLWQASGPHDVSIAVSIVGHDGYGETTPIALVG